MHSPTLTVVNPEQLSHPKIAKRMKACPLCRCANVRSTETCYVCGWAGSFDFSPRAVQAGLDDLAYRNPELMEVLVTTASRDRTRPNLVGILRTLFRRLDETV